MTEWRDLVMADVMAEFYDGPHATPPPAYDGPVYLGIKNLTESGMLDLSSVRHIDEADFAKWTKRVTPRPGDIVFSYEATLHRYAFIPEGFHGCLGRRLALIRPNRDVVDPRFLHLLLLGPAWRATVQARIISGATVDRIPITTFPEFPITLPPLAYQRRIVGVLGAIDDLIENNRRRVEVLEEMARTIYREWFVHFRYPGHDDVPLVDSDLGPIPSGWQVGSFSELVQHVRDTSPQEQIPDGAVLVGLEHLPRRSTTLTAWGSAGDVGSRKGIFRAGDLLFGKIRPYFHKVVVAPLHGYCSTDAIVFRPADGCGGLALSVASSDDFVAYATQTSNGTKMPRANTDLLLDYAIPIPQPRVAEQYEATIGPTVRLCSRLSAESRSLAGLRDLLLPRLVTGRIDVSELDLDALVDDALDGTGVASDPTVKSHATGNGSADAPAGAHQSATAEVG